MAEPVASAAAAAPSAPAAVYGRGILLMLATMVLFVAADTTAKYLTQSYPVAQIVWARFVFQFVVVAICLGPGALTAVRTQCPKLQIARSVLQIGSTVTFFIAVSLLPLATAITINFLQPLLITALSVPLLGERVGPRRWAAVACGFLGVVVIVRPGAAIEWAAVLPLVTATFSALHNLATRVVARIDPLQTTLFYSAVLGTLVSSAMMPFVWQAPDLVGWILLALVGFLAGLGHLLMVQATVIAPVSLLAPFNYTQLVWATAFGYAVFGDLLDGWTLIGALIIVGSGLYVFHRERRLGVT
jgi:drug/metabolite transporter (DMT)-like permease